MTNYLHHAGHGVADHPATGAASTAKTPQHLVGNTPVLWIPELTGETEAGFWAKLESRNPGGIKDRPGLYLLDQARKKGDLAPGGAVIESTSGTLGLGLALAGMLYGHPVTLVTDVGMEAHMRRLLTAYGATVDIVDRPDPKGGWQQARRNRVAQLLEEQPGAWCPDQYHNPDNVSAYEGLAHELTIQLDRVDVLVCSVGTGGHSAGVSRVLREANPGLQLLGVDTIGSTIFGQPDRPRLMRGLGSSIYPRNVDYQAFSQVHWVAPPEAVWACRRLAATRYLTGGWSVGAVAVVASWAARTYPPDTRVVAIFPDGGARYVDTIFNDGYCRQHHLLDRPPAPQPDRLDHPQEREVTRWTSCTTVIDPAPRPRADVEAPSGSGPHHTGRGVENASHPDSPR
ncbi:PLP-dependent cysteine synthase family protein [Micromonospora alfalfae]|uniref:PLP-dependent cysteine synthase family protein n=1 Tax=Micromonospora alfalfae TaxID=2911212 RepID=UPI0027DF5EFC|nr:PLP-dependent cysteine synthase family protein [Micromonospora alfalfae]